MADFFENLENFGKMISDKAGEVADVVAKKAEETVEVTKLKSRIGTMERSNERDYKDIGKMIYEKYKKGESIGDEFAELCEAISEREVGISEAKEEIARLKGMDVCPQCEAHLEAGVKFCPKCGAKIDDEVSDAEFDEE